jgi:hypothetical protein
VTGSATALVPGQQRARWNIKWNSEEDQGKERQERRTKRPVGATACHRKQSRSVEWNKVRTGSGSNNIDRDGVGNSISNRGNSEQGQNIEQNSEGLSRSVKWNKVQNGSGSSDIDRDGLVTALVTEATNQRQKDHDQGTLSGGNSRPPVGWV